MKAVQSSSETLSYLAKLSCLHRLPHGQAALHLPTFSVGWTGMNSDDTWWHWCSFMKASTQNCAGGYLKKWGKCGPHLAILARLTTIPMSQLHLKGTFPGDGSHSCSAWVPQNVWKGMFLGVLGCSWMFLGCEEIWALEWKRTGWNRIKRDQKQKYWAKRCQIDCGQVSKAWKGSNESQKYFWGFQSKLPGKNELKSLSFILLPSISEFT